MLWAKQYYNRCKVFWAKQYYNRCKVFWAKQYYNRCKVFSVKIRLIHFTLKIGALCLILRCGQVFWWACSQNISNSLRKASRGLKLIAIYGVNRVVLYSKTNQMHNIWNLFYFGTTLYRLRTVSPSIIRSLRLYIQHHTIQVLWLLASKQPQ